LTIGESSGKKLSEQIELIRSARDNAIAENKMKDASVEDIKE